MRPTHPNAATALALSAERRPDVPAIVSRDERLTWSELALRAGAFADVLRHARVFSGDRVAIFVDRTADAAAAFYGTLSIGAIAVNVNPTLKPRQIEHILSHSGARMLIADRTLLEKLPRAIESRAELVEIADVPRAAELTPAYLVGADVAHIIYTSGSTGLPKGVTISHDNVRAGTEAVCEYLELAPTDRLASVLPFSFDYGLNQLFCAAHLGATLVIERSPLAPRIVASLAELEVSVLAAVPPLWMQLQKTDAFKEPIPSLRLMTNSGGRVPVAVVRALREAQPQARLFLMYGLTEAFRSTYLPPEELERRPGSIGIPIPGADVLVVDEHGNECPPGVEGELVHRGPTVSLGYWNDPLATAKVFRPNPLRPTGAPDAERVVFSGDTVRRDEDGFLYFVARADKMLKTMGFRVSPDEVVDALHDSGHVVEAIVVGEPDDQAGTRIVAHVVLAPGKDEAGLAAWCKKELPRYVQPARIEVHAALPRTASGKHDPKAMLETGTPGAERSTIA